MVRVKLNANSVTLDTVQIPELKTTSVAVCQRNLSDVTQIYPIYCTCPEDGVLRIIFNASHTSDLSMDINVIYKI